MIRESNAMSAQPNKFLITQSLLSAWLWAYKLDNGYEDFLKTLHREPIQPTKAMLDGQRFENVVNAVATGAEIEPTHEWYKPVTDVVGYVKDAQQQVKLSRDISVQGVNFVIYGVLDYLKRGVIYDTKYSKTYHVGKYLASPQHPMYFALVPEAYRFDYLISDGDWVYRETYRPDDVEPIEATIKHFMDYLDSRKLVDTFCENWRSKY